MAVDQPVARIGDPTTTGHGCDATTTVIGPTGATAKVYANNLGIECKDNPTAAHTIPSGSECVNHPAKINEGSDSVFIANIPVARVTDSTDGGAITSGSPNVFVGKAPGTFGISSVSVSIYIPEGDQTSAVTLVDNYVAAQTGQNIIFNVGGSGNSFTLQTNKGVILGCDGSKWVVFAQY